MFDPKNKIQVWVWWGCRQENSCIPYIYLYIFSFYYLLYDVAKTKEMMIVYLKKLLHSWESNRGGEGRDTLTLTATTLILLA